MLSRREFVRNATLMAAAMPLATTGGSAADSTPAAGEAETRGQQRLPLEKLKQWEDLGYGMFMHFGMSTFSGVELSDGNSPASLYAPDHLDVDQWVSVA